MVQKNTMRQFFSFSTITFLSLSCFPLLGTSEILYRSEKATIQQNHTKSVKEEEIILYIKSDCPFCKRVLQALKKLNLDITIVDISKDSQATARLISIGGKKQVPCLVVDGKATYESSSIIEHLKEKRQKLTQQV